MSKVTAKYQITIPPEIRNELGIVPGGDVVISRRGDHFVLVVNPIEDLKRTWRGRFKGRQTSDEYLNTVRGRVE